MSDNYLLILFDLKYYIRPSLIKRNINIWRNLKTRPNIYRVIALVLLLTLKAGFSFYVTDRPLWVFPFQNSTDPFFPSTEDDAVHVYSIPPNISLAVSERNVQNNPTECYKKYRTAGIHFASVQLHQKSREYIRYSSGIKPSLESTRLIYPFHSFL